MQKIKSDYIDSEESEGSDGSGTGAQEIKKALFIFPQEKSEALLQSHLILEGYDKNIGSQFAKKFSAALDSILTKIYLLRSKQLQVIVSALLSTGFISPKTNKSELKKLFKIITDQITEFQFMNQAIKKDLMERRIEAKTRAIVTEHNDATQKTDKKINIDGTSPSIKRR